MPRNHLRSGGSSVLGHKKQPFGLIAAVLAVILFIPTLGHAQGISAEAARVEASVGSQLAVGRRLSDSRQTEDIWTS